MKPFSTVKQLLEKLQKKEFSSPELLDFYRKRIDKYNPKLNAFLEVFDDKLVQQESTKKTILNNIPGALKNNLSIKDKKITCASNILKNYKSTYDATVTQRLREAGGMIIGTTNMDEFAMGASGEFSALVKQKIHGISRELQAAQVPVRPQLSQLDLFPGPLAPRQVAAFVSQQHSVVS